MKEIASTGIVPMSPRRSPVADLTKRSEATDWSTHVRTVRRREAIMIAIAAAIPRARASAAIATALRERFPAKKEAASRPGAPKRRRKGRRDTFSRSRTAGTVAPASAPIAHPTARKPKRGKPPTAGRNARAVPARAQAAEAAAK